MISDLTLTQEAALFTLKRRNSLAKQIVEEFKGRDVLATKPDYDALEKMGLAVRQRHDPRFHELTPLGSYKAGQLIIARAREMRLPIHFVRRRRASIFSSGQMSQNGNW